MNSAGDNEKRTDYDHESRVIDSRVNDARGLLNNEKMIQTNYAGESDAKFVVMPLPMMLSDEWSECDRHEQDYKRQHDRPVRACGDETQDPNHLGIGLIVVRSVNETRLGDACFAERSKTPGARSLGGQWHSSQACADFDLGGLREHVERCDRLDDELILQLSQIAR